jgi:MerR family redox-sensitive transcriptional activator SoxR
MPDFSLTIGELARRAGVATSALRYYEDLGLLPAPARVSGQRRYPSSAVGLAEQKALMTSRSAGADAWRRLAERKLTELDERIANAQIAREAVEHALRCPHDDILQCPTLSEVITARLAGKPLSEAHHH